MKQEGILRHYVSEFESGNDVGSDGIEPLFDALINSSDEDLIVRLLSVWNLKGASEDEIFALASILRGRMLRVTSRHHDLIDIVGTGGSSAKTFNVSTAAAFVTAGAGVAVAKHGNRAATSRSGSADVLAELGIAIDEDPGLAEENLNEHGLCFLFAPLFHRLSPTLAAARRRVCSPTVFNIVGPLCNPASPPYQLIGVWRSALVETMARALSRLGTARTWVVHSSTGLDEISIDDVTFIAEVGNGNIRRFQVTREDFGLSADGKDLPKCLTPLASASLVRDILENRVKDTTAERLVLVNAAAAIHVSGDSSTLAEAYSKAEESIRTGRASAKVDLLVGGAK